MGLSSSYATSSLLQLVATTLLLVVFLLGSAHSARLDPQTSSCQEEKLHLRNQHANSTGLFLPLHHIHGPCSPLAHLPRATPSEVLAKDDSRVQNILSRLSTTTARTATTASSLSSRLTADGDLQDSKAATVPLSPGSSLGVGNYVARIGLGTPAKTYTVIVDTGSSLTWLQCQPCRLSCHAQQDPVFDPKASSTYSPVGCSTPECNELETATLNPSGCARLTGVCVYQASYGDSSFSVGYLGKDTLTVGSAVVPGFVYGCGQDNEGLFGKTAGLAGLAQDKLSLLSQVAPKYGMGFTYCLPTSSSSGFLSIGASYPGGSFSYTPLVSGSDKSLYFIRLSSISVGGTSIGVPSSTQTIIDSGTVITRLPAPIYTALSQAVVAALQGSARAPAYSILDTCFKGSYKSLPPLSLKLVFAGGAALDLAPQNIFYDLSGGSFTCLAFARSSRVAIIGNRQQQTFSVAYDVSGSKVGFASGGCS